MKNFLSAIVAMSAMYANAQVETTPIAMTDSELYGVGEDYCYNHEVSVVSVEYGGTDGKTITGMSVYDENLNLKKTISLSEVPVYLEVHNLNGNTADYFMYLTQTLFNNDEKFEYVVPITTRYDRSMGLKIISDDGTILQTLMFPDNLWGYSEKFKLYRIGDSFYIEAGWYEDAEGKACMNLYKINKSADPSKVSIATAPMRVSVSPRVADSSQDITVVAEGSGLREVIVTNAVGQVVYSTKVVSGENTVRINSRHLSPGLNVVSVKGADGKDENCKVIVKK